MKKQLFPALLLCSGALSAQVMGNYGVQQQTYQNVQPNAQYRAVPKAAELSGDNILAITINALSNQKAQTYTAIFNVVQVGKTAEETNALLNQRLESFQTELKGLGIPAAEMYVDMVNFLPRYEYDVSKKMFSKKTYTEIPKGFELQKNIHIRYQQPALLEKIVTAAARQEIYDIVKVDYFVKDPQAIYTSCAPPPSATWPKSKASIARSGCAWIPPTSLPPKTPGSPIRSTVTKVTRRSAPRASMPTKKTSQDRRQAYFALLQRLAGQRLRIVLNPEILEPAVQFSYNLVVRFTLPERKPPVKPKPKKNICW